MEKLSLDAQYNDVVAAAKQLGIEYVGKKKPVLISMINDKLDAIANGEAEIVVHEPEVQDDSATDEGETAGSTPTSAQPASRQSRQPRAPRQPAAPRSKGAKWYEEANANPPYAVGDIVQIIAGDILIGRKAQFTRYSAKKDAIKCILINDKTNQLQNCEITMDFFKVEMHTPVNAPAAPVVEDKEPSVNPEAEAQGASEEATA